MTEQIQRFLAHIGWVDFFAGADIRASNYKQTLHACFRFTARHARGKKAFFGVEH